jgi:hypothetical protein
MAKLKHATTGAIVEVADEKVERLGSEWEPHDDETKKNTRGTRAKKSE